MNLFRKKIIAFSLLFVVIGVLLLPMVGFAQDAPVPVINDLSLTLHCSGGLVSEFACGLQNVILLVLDAVIGFFGILLRFFTSAAIWMINFGTTLISLPVVRAGFEVSLSVVNLLFAMGLIIAAFRIILGIGEREAKKMIGLIILAALLVNFSLLIAGFLLDISNVFTNFFLSAPSEAGGSVLGSKNIGSAFQPQMFKNLFLEKMDRNSLASFVVLLQVALFSLGMTALMMITMIALFVMALVRNLWVAFLLILMPLSWGFWGFPFLKKYHGQWWENFIKWGVIYLPSVTFFLWLSISTIHLLNSPDSPLSIPETATSAAANSGFVGVLEQILPQTVQMLILVGLIIGGLKVASSLGGVGSGIGMKLAGAAGKGAKKLGWGATKGTAGFAYRRSGTERAGKKTLRGLGMAANKVGLTGIGNTLARAGSYDKQKERYQKGMYADQTNDGLKKLLAGRVLNMDPAQRQALFDEAKKRDMLGDIPEEKVGAFAKMIKAANPGKEAKDVDELKELARAFPDLAPQITGQTKSEVLSKMDGKALGNLSKKQLEDDDTVLTLTRNQLTTAARASGEKEATINGTLIGLLKKSGSGVKSETIDKLNNIEERIAKAREAEKNAAKPEEGREARAELRAAITQRTEIVDKLDPKQKGLSVEAKNALEKIKHLAINVGSTGAQAKGEKKKERKSPKEEAEEVAEALDDLGAI